jgi:hypothetical protein
MQKTCAFSAALLFALSLTAAAQNAPAQIPHLQKQGSATQLIVGEKPFLILGGELHNSSSSNLDYMRPVWRRMTAMNFNTVLAAVSWELIEPEEGHYDFRLVDGLITSARRTNLRLVFLWFGSWKNGSSSYAPVWVKKDTRRFPRVLLQDGRSPEVLSTFGRASWEADAKAFGALLGHIKEFDAGENTVLMAQVENEVGVLGDSRDRSEPANAAFGKDVPKTLLESLKKNKETLYPALKARWEAAGARTSGTWEQVFGAGPETDEIFMAWHYASYVEKVAEAGKAEYPIPLYVNTWLSDPDHKPGNWPSGGPEPQVSDIWRAAAPHLDLLSPDIYQPNFAEWCQRYTYAGNPLFIPEMQREADGARNVFYAIGQHDAIGTSPFAVDSMENVKDAPLGKSYDVLKQLAPTILQHQGRGEMTGFLLDKAHPQVKAALGGYDLIISLESISGTKAETGYGLIIVTGPDEFVGAGNGFRVAFVPKTPGPKLVGIATLDEGTYFDGAWTPGRRLNGDESDQGGRWRFSPRNLGIERCTVYRYE